MAREYMVIKSMDGAKLQITEDRKEVETIDLHAASDNGLIKEAEQHIEQRYHEHEPFNGFHWQQMGSNGFRTTDYDLR